MMKQGLTVSVVALLLCGAAFAGVRGDYLEVRSCDVYTGPCFANAEMDLSGKEALLVWKINEGEWNGVSLAGCSVVLSLRGEKTFGDIRWAPQRAEAVVYVDAGTTSAQEHALVDFVNVVAGHLIDRVVAVHRMPMSVSMKTCQKQGCAEVTVGDTVHVKTRCMKAEDHYCGNETPYYPALTPVKQPYPAFTEAAASRDRVLGMTWETVNTRGTFLASFDVERPTH
jgi:hypothetical protein